MSSDIQDTVRRVSRWTRHEVAATEATILTMLTEVYMSGTFGYDEPEFIRMGKGFHDTLRATMLHADPAETIKVLSYNGCEPQLRVTDHWGEIHTFMGARVRLDTRMDSWLAQVFIWDRETYELPILFCCGTVRLVDAQ